MTCPECGASWPVEQDEATRCPVCSYDEITAGSNPQGVEAENEDLIAGTVAERDS